LFKTSPTRVGTIDNFEKLFFDPSYQKMLHSLPADSKQHIMQPLRKKIADIIYDEKSGTGVLHRIKQTAKELEHTDVKWSVGSDGQVVVGMDFKATGKGSAEFQKEITASHFGDNIDRLNNYIELFNSLMPKSFDKTSFTNSIVDVLVGEKPKSESNK